MTFLLFIAIYASAACFLIGCILRIRQYASLPAHLRWELYPVPHEAPERARYGGSHFEESEWWTKPRHFHAVGELRVMLAEIFLFKSLWHDNRNLWWRSLSFHFGMYAVIASLVLAFAGLWTAFARIAGLLGLLMVALGAFALLQRRMADRELRDYTHVADYVHLGSIACISAMLFFGCLSAHAPSVLSFAHALITADSAVLIPNGLFMGLLLASALLAYIPYSHMAHFIAKYFTFHAVRWDDAPMSAGSSLHAKMRANLARCPTWSAPHIAADGQKTWADIATANPAATEVRS